MTKPIEELTLEELDLATGYGVGDMSSLVQMELQMAMDRKSKFVEAVSNILKSTDDTSSQIVKNLKS